MSTTIRIAQVTAASVDGTATQLLAADLSGRVSVAIRNTHATGTLYLAFSEAAATTADAWPVRAGEVWAADLRPGVALWGVSDGATLDVRVMEGAE